MKSSQTVVLTVHKGNSTYVDAKMQVDVDFVALARAKWYLGDVRAATEIAAFMPGAGLAARQMPLTRREVHILTAVAKGLGNKEIAWRLDISEHTVKFHIGSIFTKLGAQSRTEAVTIGVRHGLIMI